MSDVPVQIRRVWDQVPSTNCKGLCVDSCGPISASPLEQRLLAAHDIRLVDPIAELTGFVITGTANDCPALVDGRCSVYEIRPTVCRLWGAVEDMPCPYGCEPEGGRLSRDAGRRILNQSLEHGQIQSRSQRRSRR